MKKEILYLSKEIIDELLISRGPAHVFESFGIRDGKDIIQNYVENREYVVAYEHLEYIIAECNISLSDSQGQKMKSIAEKFK